MKLTDLIAYKAQLATEYAKIPKWQRPRVSKAEVNLLWVLIQQGVTTEENSHLTSVNWHERVPTEKEQLEELRCFIRLMKYRHLQEQMSRG